MERGLKSVGIRIGSQELSRTKTTAMIPPSVRGCLTMNLLPTPRNIIYGEVIEEDMNATGFALKERDSVRPNEPCRV